MAAAPHLAGERRSGLRGKRARIVRHYTNAPPQSTVFCVDELGPVAAKACAGPSWSEAGHRPHFRPDYRRHGYVRAYGALAHRCGRVLVDIAERRTTASWLHFLDQPEGFVPPGDAYLIEGFWKILSQRTLHGRTCRRSGEVAAALKAGAVDWDAHPTPFVWGRPPKPERRFKRAYVYRL